MRSRKHTAWKKNRKFGDLHGGRTRLKITDNIFNRAHSLSPPGPDESIPVLMEMNPSSNYFFPLDGGECLEALKALPSADTAGITHLWLRRLPSRQARSGHPLAEFICGSGVRLIVIYPWRKDLRLCLGRAKPSGKSARAYSRFGAAPFQERGSWYVEFTLPELRRFYVQVLFHEVGHHVDAFSRHWSKANHKEVEEFADQYAMSFSSEGAEVLNRLSGD